MSRFRRSLIATLVAFVPLVPLLAAANAHAAAPVPFTINEQINFNTDPFTDTFTATGPLCPSGTFTDDQTVAAGHPNGANVENFVAHTVYTCADGSGTFNALKLDHVIVTPGVGITNAGDFELQRGTGAYTSLSGHGVNNGTFSFQTGTGVGNISGTAQP